MYNFCTLFDSKYLSRGIALYESLESNLDDFRLFIFAFDDICYDILKKMNLEKATIISLHEFEDEKLLAVKNSRSKGEYCWTSTPSTILFAIEKYNLDSCTYLDSDLYFFQSPQLLFEELGDDSVLITEHRYTPRYDQSKNSGKYCVQFMTFKNDHNGMKVLKWWRDACIDWCYNRFEDGKFGDQKYLDDWTERFQGVHELRHLGGGVAPWNVQQYKFYGTGSSVMGEGKNSGDKFQVIFYHFHEMQFYTNGKINLCNYQLSNNAIEFIYRPYITAIGRVSKKLTEIGAAVNFNNADEWDSNNSSLLTKMKRKVKGNYNLLDSVDFNNTNN